MNRPLFAALAACVLVAACGDNPTAPSTQPIVFTAMLSPATEVPPVVGAETAGSGAAQIHFDVARDAANTITGATAMFYFELHNYPNNTIAFAAHIHRAPAGVAGPVVVSTGLSAASAPRFSNGAAEFRSGPVAVSAALAQEIVANPAAFYFNVHSPLNPGGFARGQLTRIQ